MSEERSIGLSSNGPPETVLPPPPEPLTEALAVAVGRDAVDGDDKLDKKK